VLDLGIKMKMGVVMGQPGSLDISKCHYDHLIEPIKRMEELSKQSERSIIYAKVAKTVIEVRRVVLTYEKVRPSERGVRTPAGPPCEPSNTP